MLGYGALSIFHWIASCRTAVSLHQAATKENQGAADCCPGAGPESPQPQLSFWRTTFLTAGYFSSCCSLFLSFCVCVCVFFAIHLFPSCVSSFAIHLFLSFVVCFFFVCVATWFFSGFYIALSLYSDTANKKDSLSHSSNPP